jgi:uncharacterized membrane protein YkgB
MTELAQIDRATRIQGQANDLHCRAAISSPLRIVVPIRPNLVANENVFERLRDFSSRHVLFLSRVSLAAVFFWFGVLKVANVSPVASLLRASIPFLAERPYLEILGVVEIVIGVGLLANRLATQASVLMILHLAGTLSLFVIAPRLVFAPTFPVLTMEGEFVLKNVVLIASALVIMVLRPRARLTHFTGRNNQVNTSTTRQSAMITSAQKKEMKSL